MEGSIGILSLLPPILAIALAIISRQVVLSLFAGVYIGAILLSGYNPVAALYPVFGDFIFNALGNWDNAAVVVMVVECGAFSLLLEKGGGAHAFAKALTKNIKTGKQAQLLAAAGGTAIFFSDSTNPMLVGPIFRPITDAVRVSREKLAYITDATTATMPSMIFFSAWGAYIIGIVAQQFTDYNYNGNAMAEFNAAVPFMFYTVGAVIFVYVTSAFGFEFGPMRKAQKRAFTQGKLVADQDVTDRLVRTVVLPEKAHPTVAGMAVPIIVLILAIFGGLMYTGGFLENHSFTESMANASSMRSLDVGFLIACVVAGAYAVKAEVMTAKEAFQCFMDGMAQMMEACAILVLSWSLGSVCKAVGTTNFVVEHTQDFLTPTMMYVLLFVVGAATAFSTGTSWGTFAIYLPIGIPLAMAIGAPVHIAIGAVVSAGIFGDHCSPISDTTVLSSLGSSCNHIAHVTTQLPYALVVAFSTAVAFIFVGVSGGTSVGTGLIGCVITVVLSTVIGFIWNRMEEAKDPQSAWKQEV